MKVLVSGGKSTSSFDYKKPEWNRSGIGVLGLLDLESGKFEMLLEYITPPEFTHDEDPGITFKSFSNYKDDGVLVVTSTEVVIFNLKNRKVEQVISHRLMNDVHHAIFHDNKFYVANTGRDSVLILDEGGELIEECFTYDEPCEKPIHERFLEVKDFRKLKTTKPHNSHPNYVSVINGEIWVTRFLTKDTYRLRDKKTVSIGVGNPHDGVQHGEEWWFTTTNGHILSFDGLEKMNVLNLLELEGYKQHLGDMHAGWMRGFTKLDNNNFLAGFSTIRPTKSIEFLMGLKNKLKGVDFKKSHPTRLDMFSSSGEFLRSYDLSKYGYGLLYTAHPVNDDLSLKSIS